MDLGPGRPSSAKRSMRAIAALPHLSGGFPGSMEAGWCVREGQDHASLVEGQQEVVLGEYLRPVLWPPDFSSWTCGPVSAGKYFEILVEPSLLAWLHNDVQPERQGETQVSIPSELKANLYQYQRDGFAKMKGAVDRGLGVLLCDEMGLGKTVQAIALLLDQAALGGSLVIVPSSLLTNWKRELDAFAPALTVTLHCGPGRAGVSGALAGWDVVLTSYETAINDASFLSDLQWNLMVLDEAQKIKNAETTRSRVVKGIPRRATVCVTGTPVENSLKDLWSLSEASLPPLLGSLARFEAMFPDDAASAAALGRIVYPITVRRAVAEVAKDLPPLVSEDVAVDMAEPLRGMYDLWVSTAKGLEAVTRARVIAAHGSDDPFGELVGSAKGDVVLQMLGEAFAREEKVLVFASFKRSLDRLSDLAMGAFSQAYLSVVDGRVSGDERQRIIDEFSSFPGRAALFLNPQAAGVGLNITAANHVIHFNPEWNPAVTMQATARSYRRKQGLPVFVHHLYYANTVEDDAMVRAAHKAALAAEVGAAHYSEEKLER